VGALDVFPPPVNESPHTVIEPSALRAAKEYAGVIQILEAKTHSLTKAISKFIQMQLPLLLLKPTVRSRCGVVQILEVQTHPLTKVISRFIQLHITP
jgi:hypothetical protein